MKTIYKYQLKINATALIEMPKDYEVISVISDGHNAFIYAMVETTNPSEEVVFNIYGTGHELPEDILIQLQYNKMKFIGTIQLNFFVWHIYIKKWK